MPSPTARSLALLRRRGFIACPVERWIARAGVRQDAFGFADVLAAHPRERAILLVQATTAAHVSHRLAKARARPELAAWLRAGGRFSVWGWARRNCRWHVREVDVQGEELQAVPLSPPRRRRGRRMHQRELF